MDNIEFTQNNLKTAPQGFLLNMAIMLLDTIKKQDVYDETEYGSVKNMKKWDRNKLINWLLQFDISLSQTDEKSKNEKEKKEEMVIDKKIVTENDIKRESLEADNALKKAEEEYKKALKRSEEVKKASEFAQQSPFPEDKELYTDVYL